MKIKKLLICISIFHCLFLSTFAQYATIPDPEFRKFLKSKYSCFNAQDQLDTTCIAVLSDTSMILNSTGQISSLEGVHYFKSLRTLNCSGKSLLSLPKIPSGLLYLDCSSNKLTKLPNLPEGLKTLICSENVDLVLGKFPSSLITLYCKEVSFTDIASLPSELLNLWMGLKSDTIPLLPPLPPNLVSLSIFGTRIGKIPPIQNSIKQLDLENNRLSEMPVFPEDLLYLNYSYNTSIGIKSFPKHLIFLWFRFTISTFLPPLPNTVRDLNCQGNYLKNLPPLPDSLRNLDCQYNNLTNLPPFPEKLESVIAYMNDITSLPTFNKNLLHIYISYNPLTCLPKINKGLLLLDVDPDSVKCIPNTYAGDEGHIPLCNSTNNVNNCLTSSQMLGRVFFDANKDGIYNTGEILVPNVNVRIKEKNNFNSTSANGQYTIGIDTLGTYTFIPDSVTNFKLIPVSKTINFTSYNQESTQDFALVESAVREDLGTQLTTRNFGRPGFPMTFEIDFYNAGTTGETLTPSFNYPSEFVVDSVTGSGKFNNTSVLWAAKNYQPLQQNKERIFGHILVGT